MSENKTPLTGSNSYENPLVKGREIKFRAWLLKENKMVMVDTLSNNKGYGGALEIIIDNPLFDPTKKSWEGENRPYDLYLNHSMQVHKERNNGDDFVLMQFTGLMDKNNNPIYEGDIVKKHIEFYTDPADFRGRRFVKKDYVYFIEWGKWCYIKRESINDLNYFSFDIIEAIEYEIIGNIYSNPELLKQ